MKNYFSYPKGMENSIEWKINKNNIICYVSECSKTGGILPYGIQVYSNYKNIKEENKGLALNAIEQVKGILALKESTVDFIRHWKMFAAPTEEDRNYIFDEAGRMKGLCFELAGIHKNDTRPAIELPRLYALVNKTDDDNANCICFYGDKPELEACIHIAMHLCCNGTYEDKAEFAFLTPIPDEWYDNK